MLDCFIHSPLFLELLKGLPAAFVTFAVGMVGWVLTRMQIRISKAKLNLDLFERRLAIFDSTWSFLAEVNSNSPEWIKWGHFSNIIPEGSFLFGKDISEYLTLVMENFLKLKAFNEKIHLFAQELDEHEEKEHAALHLWFSNEAKTVKDRFNKYLDFSAWHTS